MEIVPFRPRMAGPLTRCYNDVIAPVPHAHPVGTEAFSSLARLASKRCRGESLLMACEGRDLLGFVHVGIARPAEPPAEPGGEPGVIRFLGYGPGRRAAGRALLEAAEAWVRARGRTAVVACHSDYKYSFYHWPEIAHLSDHLIHIHALFGKAGYQVNAVEVFFDWPDFQPPLDLARGFPASRGSGPWGRGRGDPEPIEGPPPVGETADAEIALDWSDAPSLTVRALREGNQIGACRMRRYGDQWPAPDASDWCFCLELGVQPAWQGRGLGKVLLAAGLAQMRGAGCRHAAISTSGDNYRAALFYGNFGFRFSDRTVAFRRELD